MKKDNIEIVRYLLEKIDNADNNIEYNTRRWNEEQASAKDEEREPNDYYRQYLEQSMKEKAILLKLYELV